MNRNISKSKVKRQRLSISFLPARNLKNLLLIGLLMFLTSTLFLNGLNASTTGVSAQEDSTKFVTVKGKIIDANTKKPIPYTNIYLTNSNIGTISNNDGEFILKVPRNNVNAPIRISYMGYKNQDLTIEQIEMKNNLIELSTEVVTLKELVIRSNDPQNLIRSAIHNIPVNYGTAPYLCTAFYRESVMQNKSYVGLAEAVLNIYKSKYNNEFESDRVKVYKGRKSQDVKKMDTIMFKLQGGHQAVVLLDLAKNPETFMTEQYFNDYEFKPVNITNIEGRQTYVIEFTQRESIQEPLYEGKLYIDLNSLAIRRAEFSISPYGLQFADKYLVKKKPIGTDVKTVGANYVVSYREQDGKWILNHARYEVKFRVIKRGKFFNKIYTSAADLAVTDIDTKNVEKFKFNETLKPNQVFVDRVDEYYDEEFWGNYNIIKPEESLEDAVERINRKMRKLSSL
ncbi:MAG TPA: carboxypeptidase-like regulatory domain-containing protein [Bacteroidales bacterium]|nr:carboxypeptidase-like regulatory domain-containing protein [Bacteroidales bacterium]